MGGLTPWRFTIMTNTVSEITADDLARYLDSNWYAPLIAVALIVLLAILAGWIWRRFIQRTTAGFNKSAVTRYIANDKESRRDRDIAIERYRARAATVSAMLTSVGTFVIVTVALLFALSALGLNIAPLLASAGIAGIAIGFGAQTIVRDFLSGVFMILENQYGVGDVVSVNGVTGTVEDVGLRITELRDADGTIWYVTNGSITELGNRSQGWSVAVVDVPVAQDADLELAKEVLTQAVSELQQDPAWSSRIMPDEPIVGVESITATSVTIRIRLHTVHEQQVAVAREIRGRAINALDAADVPRPYVGVAPPESPTPPTA